MQRVQVGGHAAKGDGHPVVIKLLPVVSRHVGGQKLVDAAVGEQRVTQKKPVLEAEGQRLGNLMAVLAAAEAGIGIRSLQREDIQEGVAFGQGAHLRG
jgi:hypothetical protein